MQHDNDNNSTVKAIRSVWARGDTAQSIGDKLGLSRQAITGYYYRWRPQLSDKPLAGTLGEKYFNPEPIKEFNARIKDWLPFLRIIARRMVSDIQDVDDLVNETVVAAIERRRSYRPDGSFPSWLVFHMRERFRFMRKQRSVKASSYDDDDGFVERTIGSPARQDAILEAKQVVDSIPDGDAKVMLLRAAIGDDYASIGDDYGMSKQAVEQRIKRERKKVGKRLNTVRMAA